MKMTVLFVCSICLLIASAIMYRSVSQPIAMEYVALSHELSVATAEYDRASESAYTPSDLDVVNQRICGIDYQVYQRNMEAIYLFYAELFDSLVRNAEPKGIPAQMRDAILCDGNEVYLDRCLPVMLKDGRYYCIVRYTTNVTTYMIGAMHEVDDGEITIIGWDALIP